MTLMLHQELYMLMLVMLEHGEIIQPTGNKKTIETENASLIIKFVSKIQ